MRPNVLEKSVTDLQRRVAEIEEKLSDPTRNGWRRIVGAARDDQHFAEAMQLGAKWRKRANRERW